MQTRRSAIPPLNLILPHPSLALPRRSMLAPAAPSPRTPRSCRSPCSASQLFFAPNPNPNRKSTDSWNSSNQDADDDPGCEWKAEQTLLLSRVRSPTPLHFIFLTFNFSSYFQTLDALPAHLLTPFNGPLPPSNLLDKIARGVAHAKGPAEWPHSVRATRAKLLDLARAAAKEQRERARGRSIAEEDDYEYAHECAGGGVLQAKTNVTPSPRRPLYRQSSMDFLASAKLESSAGADALARSTRRLPAAASTPPAYHPYLRPHTRSQSRSTRADAHASPEPDFLPRHPSSTTLHTATSTTLNSSTATTTARRRYRLSLSSASSVSSSSDVHMQAPDPRVQRIRRADFLPPSPGKRQLKRAPSFGFGAASPSPVKAECVSSDEEERVRTKGAKKARVGAVPAIKSRAVPASPSPRHTPRAAAAAATPAAASSKPAAEKGEKAGARPRANLQRNPSIFGAPLPALSAPPAPAPALQAPPQPQGPPPTPRETRERTLRRTHAAADVGRRISFGSLVPSSPASPQRAGGAAGALGSAFQLH